MARISSFACLKIKAYSHFSTVTLVCTCFCSFLTLCLLRRMVCVITCKQKLIMFRASLGKEDNFRDS